MLHECLERVPEDIDAMRELLQYGLQGTDLKALVAIGKGEDGGRLVEHHFFHGNVVLEFFFFTIF